MCELTPHLCTQVRAAHWPLLRPKARRRAREASELTLHLCTQMRAAHWQLSHPKASRRKSEASELTLHLHTGKCSAQKREFERAQRARSPCTPARKCNTWHHIVCHFIRIHYIILHDSAIHYITLDYIHIYKNHFSKTSIYVYCLLLLSMDPLVILLREGVGDCRR